MPDKGRTDNEDGKDNKENESGLKMLYSFILDPPKNRLPELTDLPLLQVPSLTWMAANDEMVEMCVEYIRYASDLRRYNEAIKNGDKKAKKPVLPTMKMLPERWREWLYKHRRSLAGAGVKTAAVLAERQIEVQAEQPSGDQLREPPRD